jgi:hypothetical protein
MSNPIAIWAIGFSGLCLLLSACETVPTKTYQIRQRAFTYNPAALIQGYQESTQAYNFVSTSFLISSMRSRFTPRSP